MGGGPTTPTAATVDVRLPPAACRLPPTFRDEGIHAAIRARRRCPGPDPTGARTRAQAKADACSAAHAAKVRAGRPSRRGRASVVGPGAARQAAA